MFLSQFSDLKRCGNLKLVLYDVNRCTCVLWAEKRRHRDLVWTSTCDIHKTTVIQPCVFWKYMRKYRTNSSFVKIRTTTVLIYPSGFEALFMHGFHLCSQFREAFFWFPSAKVAEMDGRAGAKKREISRKRSAGAADDQDFSKIARSKKNANFEPSKRTGWLTGTKNILPLFISHLPKKLRMYGSFLVEYRAKWRAEHLLLLLQKSRFCCSKTAASVSAASGFIFSLVESTHDYLESWSFFDRMCASPFYLCFWGWSSKTGTSTETMTG